MLKSNPPCFSLSAEMAAVLQNWNSEKIESVLINLFEYCNKSYIEKTRFFGLHFCCREYESSFN